jgi:hypothetical protein
MIDRNFLLSFNEDALAALEEVARRHGVSITKGNGRFAREGSNATIKFELATIGSGGEVNSKEAVAWKRDAARYGLDPDALGTLFRVGATEYRITGLNTRRPKFPVSATRVPDGKVYKFRANQLPLACGKSEPEGLTPAIKRAFAGHLNALSPENLTCGGECSPAEVRARASRIRSDWRVLEGRVGRTVSEEEAYSFGL